MYINPSKLVFEDKNDIVDYVSKGLPPKKKDLEKVIDAIHGRPVDDPANEIVINPDLFIIEPDEFEDVIRRIYENNCRKRNYMIAAACIAGVILIGAKIAKHAKEKKEQDDFDAEVERFIIEHPELDVERM